jgi:outer membrane biosynthesis protein TonB
MRLDPRSLSIAAVAILATACSSQPKQAEPAAAATAAPASAVADAKDSSAPAVNTALVRKGYQAVRQNDDLVYCRSETVTGTQFKRKVCLSEQQLLEQERKAKEMQESMTKPRSSPACSPAPCGG